MGSVKQQRTARKGSTMDDRECSCGEIEGEIYAIEDPWGGFHGWICEACNDDAIERQTELGG